MLLSDLVHFSFELENYLLYEDLSNRTLEHTSQIRVLDVENSIFINRK